MNTYPEIAFQVFELTHNGFSGRYCGSIPPPVIRSVSNKLIIRFSTDAVDAGSGFNATYWNEECKCVHHNYDSALRVIMDSYILLDFSLTVKAATLIFIYGRGWAISSAKEGKSGFIYNLLKRK